MSPSPKIGTVQADGQTVELLATQREDNRWVVVLNEPSALGDEGNALWASLQDMPSKPTFGSLKQEVSQRLSNPKFQFSRDQPTRNESPDSEPAPVPADEPEAVETGDAPVDDAPEPATVDEAEVVDPTELDEEEAEVAADPNKSEAELIRDYLAKNPDAANKDVVAVFAEQGVEITSSQVSYAKRQLKG